MSYLEDKLRNGRLTQQEQDELLALINAAVDAANEHTKALCLDGYGDEVEAAGDAEDRTYRAVLVWLNAHTLPDASTTDTRGTGSGVSS